MVHEYGSLGCSGDLAPLAHCALALMGEGESTFWRHSRRYCQRPGRGGPSPVELHEGRTGADQWHRRHTRDALSGPHRSPACCARRTSAPR
ncbi:MAG: aromatic amino acid lyase [Marmoricola sp.]